MSAGLFFWMVSLMCFAAEPAMPKGYVCYRATGPIEIDGELDEPSWQAVPWTDEFVDIEGDVKPRPRFRTRAKMLWDDQYFYVAAELEEPHVWATLTDHDAVIFQDNDFEVFIDPDGDNHEYYEIEINALNTEWDLRLPKPYRDGGPALNTWEIPGLKKAIHLRGTLNDASDRDQGWTVEIAFPWKVLAEFARQDVPPNDGDQWRINFSRVEWQVELAGGKYQKVKDTREDNWVWSPQGAIDMHKPEMWGYVQFSRARVGQARFRPDQAWPARAALLEIYHAQRAYQKAQGRWATSVAELGLKLDPSTALQGAPEIQATPEGYNARVILKLPDGTIEPWQIRQDSRIRRLPDR